MNIKLVIFCSIFFIFILSCQETQEKNNNENTPKIIGFKNGLEFDSICNLIKTETQEKISNGVIEIVIKDTFHYNKDFVIFEQILLERTGLKLNNKYQLDFEECYKEKMDSVINSKYGRNYKDSILKVAYQITDSVVKSKQ